MTTRLKILSGLVIAFILVALGGILWLSYELGPLVATAVRTFGPDITGVSVHLDGVDIAPLRGTAMLRGLVVGNPKGFHAEQALSLGEVSMTLALRSVFSDVIVIKRMSIIKPELTYEFGSDGSNLATIQRNVDRYVSQHSGGKGAVERPRQAAGRDS